MGDGVFVDVLEDLLRLYEVVRSDTHLDKKCRCEKCRILRRLDRSMLIRLSPNE